MEHRVPYTPLAQSALWRDMEASMETYGALFPTRLHYFEHLFLVTGNGMEWKEGRLIEINARSSLPFPKPAEAATQEPASHYMFDFIPPIPRADFMKPDEESGRPGGFCFPLDGFAKAARIPGDVDVHHLTATMMLMKYIWQTPHCLPADGGTRQLSVVRETLNTGFAIITRRGIEGEFARACDEMSEALPTLAAYTAGYLGRCDEMARMKNASPQELLEMIDVFRARFKKQGLG